CTRDVELMLQDLSRTIFYCCMEKGARVGVLLNVFIDINSYCKMLPHFFLFFTAVCGVSPYVPHRYHFVDQSKTWTDAQSYCRQTYTDLATINNMDEMKKLNDTLKDKTDNYVWIGLNRGNRGGLWENQITGNEFCVAMYNTNRQWLDVECGDKNPFCLIVRKQQCAG
uniref:C-type lectin domain-containing protein n=1 Tax=Astyanax mexicanus TaxID=7994 RepID=A0A3B1JS76_ASTMX